MTTSIVDELKHIVMSSELKETVERAARYASEQSHNEVELEHVLLALTEDSDAAVVLTTSNVEIIQLKTDVSNQVGRIEQRVAPDSNSPVVLSDSVKRIFDASAQAAKGRRKEITGAIVLAAIVGDGSSTAAHLLRTHGMTFEAAIKALQSAGSAANSGDDEVTASARAREITVPPSEGASKPSAGQVGGSSAAGPEVEASAPQPRVEPRTNIPDEGGVSQRSGARPPQQSPIGPGGSAGPVAPAIGPAKRKPIDQGSTEFGYDAIRKRQEAQRRPDVGEPPATSVQEAHRGGAILPPMDRGRVQAPPQHQRAPDPQGGFLPPDAATITRGGDVPRTGPPTGRPFPAQEQNAPYRPTPPTPLPGEPGAPGSGVPPAGGQQPPFAAPSRGAGPPRDVHGRAVPVGGSPPKFGGGVQPGPRGVPYAPPSQSVPRTGPPPGAPGPYENVPPGFPNTAGGPARGQQPVAQQGPRTNVEAGQLIENIPRLMRVAKPTIAEVRIAKADIQGVAEGLQGGAPVHRHDVLVTKAMTVRLRAPDGGFFIEAASPETQWVDNSLGLISDEFASWRWTVTPQKSGRKRLQVIVSARTVGADGLAAETALPDQIIEVRIRTNYGRAAKRWMGWIAAAIVGGLCARFGEQIFEIAAKIAAPLISS